MQPPREPLFGKPKRLPKESLRQRDYAPAIIARKNSPGREDKPLSPPEPSPPKEPKREEPPPSKPMKEEIMITERALPTVKELLPSVGWSSFEKGKSDRPAVLDTRERRSMTYLESITRAIDANWEYPELAKRHGLQGRVVLEIIILANGHVELIKMIRSSGSSLLDEEALRAIKAAAPFAPIPPWINAGSVLIPIGMTYNDGRLNSRAAP